ncbi:MAG: TonB-dependent receptor [Pseudomonadota bacterium]
MSVSLPRLSSCFPFAWCCLALCCVLSPVVVAERANNIIEEVIVTAEFRDSSVGALPASVSVVQPSDSAVVVQHLEEVLGRIPNVNFASGASRGRYVQIRGIGERGQFSEPLNSSVGLIVDGVDLSGIGGAATLFDIQQVEVLRGPQGTLYGANGLAGLINVVTPGPSDVLSGSVRLDAGDYSAFGVGAVLSGPMSENGGFRISAQQYSDDGFMDNRFLGRDDTDNHDEATYRGKFVWQTERADWTLVVGRIDIDNGYDAFSLDNNRNTLSDQPGSDQQTTTYAGVSVAADMSERVAFEGSLTLAQSDIDYGYDEDWTFTGFDPIGYTSTDRYERERDTTTAEARWLSQPGAGLGDGQWDWVVGIYALQQDVAFDRTYTFLGGPFGSDFDFQRLAVYGEVARPLNDTWRLTLGARVERHSADYEDTFGVSFDPDDSLFGGRIRLERELDNGVFYAGITQGYKAGGFNIDGTLPADLREYDPETLWNIELGYKVRLLGDRLGLNAALFRMQRDDIQISTSTTRPVGTGGAVEFIAYTGNAAEGFNQGLEVELDYQASEQLRLFANLGWLDTEYSDYVDNSGRDLDGREQAHAPGYQFYAGAEFAFTERLRARLEMEGRDEFFFSASHPEKSDRYRLVNASVSYSAERWGLTLWGRNLTDEDYFVRGFFFGNDPRDFYTARPFTQLGDPRQVGLSLRVDF